jgi:predicted dienelactone hydrolase
MAKVGVLGHSRGTLSGLGAAAGSATWGVAREPRVQAVMGMASGGTQAATLQPALAAIRIPVLWVAGGLDQNSPQLVNEAGFNAIGGADKALLVLPEDHHRTFLHGSRDARTHPRARAVVRHVHAGRRAHLHRVGHGERDLLGC